VDTFIKENRELEKVLIVTESLIEQTYSLQEDQVKSHFLKIHARFNELMDVDKHYKRKEYLLFPYLEKYSITGPPKVMWGKHDEIREKLTTAIEALSAPGNISPEEAVTISRIILEPAVRAIPEMIMKEEEILFPMCMDKLTEDDWYAIYSQTPEFGFCLYDPPVEWKPEGISISEISYPASDNIPLSTGHFTPQELESLFAVLPIDITFVDRHDKVKFFSQGPERIFPRNRAILGRDVRMCHPPSSVHVVEKILSDFKGGKQKSAAFWIEMQSRFIYISYHALHDQAGSYLGTIEFTQDLTHLRKLEGEQRLLSYTEH
jgi:DUF438 domain-containing protein